MGNDGTRWVALPATLMLVLAAACQGKPGTPGADESAAGSAAATTDTGAMASDTNSIGAPSASTPAKGGLTDAGIVALLDEANKADSAAGAVAAKKATSADVKGFAQLMMAEHHALRVAGEGLAKQLGITPVPPSIDPLAPYAGAEMSALQKTAKGAEFDRTYIDNEVAVHQAVLDLSNQARVTTGTQQLKDLIQAAIPVIQKHLEHAQSLQKQLTPAA